MGFLAFFLHRAGNETTTAWKGHSSFPRASFCIRKNPAAFPAIPSPYLAPLQWICNTEPSTQPSHLIVHPFKVSQLLQQYHQHQNIAPAAVSVMGRATAESELLHRTELISEGYWCF